MSVRDKVGNFPRRLLPTCFFKGVYMVPTKQVNDILLFEQACCIPHVSANLIAVVLRAKCLHNLLLCFQATAVRIYHHPHMVGPEGAGLLLTLAVTFMPEWRLGWRASKLYSWWDLWPLLLTWLTVISAWINDLTSSKVVDEITYTFPNFNGETVEIWECEVSSFHIL